MSEERPSNPTEARNGTAASQEKPAELGKPIRFSTYVPEKILDAYLNKNKINKAGSYRALGLVTDGGKEFMIIEPVPVSQPLGSELSTFGPQQFREYVQNPDNFPQYRLIPPEYIALGILN